MKDNPFTVLLVIAAMPLITYAAWLLFPVMKFLYKKIDKFVNGSED